MERLEPWRHEARGQTRKAFVGTHPTPALVLRWVVEGDLGLSSGPQSTHLHNVGDGLKERIAASDQVPDRRPIKHERLVAVRQKPRPGANEFGVGRRPTSHLFVNDYTVSAQHGLLHWMPRIRRWMFQDLASTNGSWINGTRLPVRQRSLLRSCDELQLGRMVFLFLEPCDLHRYLMGDY